MEAAIIPNTVITWINTNHTQLNLQDNIILFVFLLLLLVLVDLPDENGQMVTLDILLA